jgi:hypothetical protein
MFLTSTLFEIHPRSRFSTKKRARLIATSEIWTGDCNGEFAEVGVDRQCQVHESRRDKINHDRDPLANPRISKIKFADWRDLHCQRISRSVEKKPLGGFGGSHTAHAVILVRVQVGSREHPFPFDRGKRMKTIACRPLFARSCLFRDKNVRIIDDLRQFQPERDALFTVTRNNICCMLLSLE